MLYAVLNVDDGDAVMMVVSSGHSFHRIFEYLDMVISSYFLHFHSWRNDVQVGR